MWNELNFFPLQNVYFIIIPFLFFWVICSVYVFVRRARFYWKQTIYSLPYIYFFTCYNMQIIHIWFGRIRQYCKTSDCQIPHVHKLEYSCSTFCASRHCLDQLNAEWRARISWNANRFSSPRSDKSPAMFINIIASAEMIDTLRREIQRFVAID